MTTALWFVGIFWGVPFVISWGYLLWLAHLSHDITFEGILWWRGFIPVARYRLISRRSWYGQMWERWRGCGLFLAMIVKDNEGTHDDQAVEDTIVHELRHVVQVLLFGILQPLSYLGHYGYLKAFTSLDPYFANVWERDARASAQRWIDRGRPSIYNLGTRQ